MKAPVRVAGLVGGLLLLDILLGLPGLSPPAPIASLLAPSIDLLAVAALLVVAAPAGDRVRHGLRIAAVAVLVIVVVSGAARRFGFSAALGLFGTAPVARALSCAVSILAAAAVAALGWIAAGLVIGGFQTGLVRSVFIVLVAAAALLHVLLGGRVLSPSALPLLVRDIAGLLR